MEVIVRDGTVNHGRRSLCESCRSATVIRGPRLGDEIVECMQLSERDRRVPFPVTSCSYYNDRNRPTLIEMEEMALILNAEPRRTMAGFGNPKPSSAEPDPRSET